MKRPPSEPTFITVTDLPDGRVAISLQLGALRTFSLGPDRDEIVLDRRTADELEGMLARHSMRRIHPMQGCNTSMACVMHNGCHRCQPIAEEPQP
ncbi:hypothetical protein ACGFZP_12930 [Kitasatospora sp. NPDC048239]|uniref:hypothetical protein n=1 Tax=Kitasatospora sp. NPDC048239 TaxID=3364046 RepID=UPI00371B9A2B